MRLVINFRRAGKETVKKESKYFAYRSYMSVFLNKKWMKCIYLSNGAFLVD